MAVYADAYEWVELPNTHGMAIYADGGIIASKPYAASGSYIDRMSDYCAGCRYKVKERSGPDACPFNYLYWDFIIRNEARLKPNSRMGLIYSSLDKMDDEMRQAMQDDAKSFLDKLI
jgi:deoxyribodipyrimidine photolyase-related protein